MALMGMLWWVDRWRKSTAFITLSLEEQAAYRNLLDEAWLRGGPIPNNDRYLARASGASFRWRYVKKPVLAHFTLTKDGWRNATLDKVLAQSLQRAERQKRYRATHNAAHNGRHNARGDPDPDPDQVRRTPYSPPKGGRALTRKETKAAEELRARVYGGCPHDPRCPVYEACVNRIAYERRLKVGQA